MDRGRCCALLLSKYCTASRGCMRTSRFDHAPMRRRMASGARISIVRDGGRIFITGTAQRAGGWQVHRDFKPCNLLFDHSGRVKITGAPAMCCKHGTAP